MSVHGKGAIDEILAFSDTNVWVSGYRNDGGAALFHFDGTGWSAHSAGRNRNCAALGGS